MIHSTLSSHFAQVQQGRARHVQPKVLIENGYLSAPSHTRKRGNLRAIAATARIAKLAAAPPQVLEMIARVLFAVADKGRSSVERPCRDV
jgi:hypothetical protein